MLSFALWGFRSPVLMGVSVGSFRFLLALLRFFVFAALAARVAHLLQSKAKPSVLRPGMAWHTAAAGDSVSAALVRLPLSVSRLAHTRATHAVYPTTTQRPTTS